MDKVPKTAAAIERLAKDRAIAESDWPLIDKELTLALAKIGASVLTRGRVARSSAKS
jgi:hypothetical protein